MYYINLFTRSGEKVNNGDIGFFLMIVYFLIFFSNLKPKVLELPLGGYLSFMLFNN